MDRKESIRRYRERPQPAGVYRVLHKLSGRMLVGASPDAPARLRRIQAQLELSSHPNKRLQNDWDTDGDEGFEFEVLDLLPPSTEPSTDVARDLETLLEMWIERLATDPALSY